MRKQPQPHSLEVEMEDGDRRPIRLSTNTRNKWKDAEDAINAAHATCVTCLDESGAVLRSRPLGRDDDDSLTIDVGDAAVRRKELDNLRQHRELALMLDRYGDRLNEAFERGAAASNVGQSNLVELVGNLTDQLGSTINNLHKLSIQFIQFVNGAAGAASGDEKGSDDALARFAGVLATRFIAGQGEAPKPNGAKRKE